MTSTQILRLPAVLNRVGLGKTALYALIRRGHFPRPVQLSAARAVGWRVEDVDEWLQARPRTVEPRAA